MFSTDGGRHARYGPRWQLETSTGFSQTRSEAIEMRFFLCVDRSLTHGATIILHLLLRDSALLEFLKFVIFRLRVDYALTPLLYCTLQRSRAYTVFQ